MLTCPKPADVVVDPERAMLVVQRLNDAYLSGEGLLAERADLVENQIPPGVKPLSLEHSRFLFYVVSNDHGVKSSSLYKRAKSMYAENPDLFVPENVLNSFREATDPRLVELTGGVLGTRYPRETAKTWFQNSAKLLDGYGGDPRKLLASSSESRELLKRIMSFRGYGPKTGAMLLRAALGLGFSAVGQVNEVHLPVDIHDCRISTYTGIISAEGDDYARHTALVRRVLLDACQALDMPWLDADRALWLIGSRGCVPKRCQLCPIQDLCSKAALS